MRQMSQGKPVKRGTSCRDVIESQAEAHTHGGQCIGLGKTCQGKDMDGGISLFMVLRWAQAFLRAWETSRRALNSKNICDESIQGIPSQMNPKCQEL